MCRHVRGMNMMKHTFWDAAASVTAAISLKNISEGDNPQSFLTPAPVLIFLKKILPDCISGCCRQTKNWIRKLNEENRGHIRETWERGGCPRLHNQMWEKEGEEAKSHARLVPPWWLHFIESPITSHRPAWLTPLFPFVTWIMFILRAEPLTPSL